MDQWLASKREDISNSLLSLYNCLIIPRSGFLNLGGGLETNNKITINLFRYLLEEIYPCKNMLLPIYKNEKYETNIPPVLITISEKLYESHIKKLLDVYLKNLQYAVEDDFEKRIKEYNEIAKNNRGIFDNGMPTEWENLCLQALCYVTIAIADWLELVNVTEKEITGAFNIVAGKPEDLAISNDLDPFFVGNVVGIFDLVGKSINKTGLRVISAYVDFLKDKEHKLESRIIGFAREII